MFCAAMGEANEGERRGMENLSIQSNRFSRDFLQGFIPVNPNKSDFASVKEDTEEIELSLGLSLGGRFGIDKNKKPLIRSSSIAGSITVIRDDDIAAPLPASYSTLIRTSSLPTETEEEWRKRKELQTMRRMEAKRRRSVKQRNLKSDKEVFSERTFEEERHEIEESMMNLQKSSLHISRKKFNSTVSLPFGLPSCAAAAAKQAVTSGGIETVMKGKCSFLGQPSSQVSGESQGGSSSGMSELESKPAQGSGSCNEARSPASTQSMQEQGSQDTAVGSSGAKSNENALKHPGPSMMESPTKLENRGRDTGVNQMEDMPCVFTTGDGPNGKRIDGILYKYGKGEEVRIMCVCHGSFLSPAEFVKHAGGSDVAHPLKHIVVNTAAPSSAPAL